MAKLMNMLDRNYNNIGPKQVVNVPDNIVDLYLSNGFERVAQPVEAPADQDSGEEQIDKKSKVKKVVDKNTTDEVTKDQPEAPADQDTGEVDINALIDNAGTNK